MYVFSRRYLQTDLSEGKTKPLYRNQIKLRKLLELESVSELKKWMNGGLFKPYFEELLSCHIRPAQEAALLNQQPRVRGPDLAAIEGTLKQGERNGKRRFSRPHPDKQDWGVLDHYARFLFWVRRENVEDGDGIFFNKRLSDAIMHQRIWQVYQRAAYETRLRGLEKAAERVGEVVEEEGL